MGEGSSVKGTGVEKTLWTFPSALVEEKHLHVRGED